MDPEKYINSLGVVDDEVVIKAFVIVENKSTEELKGIEATLCFLYPDFTIEVSSPQARRASCPELGF